MNVEFEWFIKACFNNHSNPRTGLLFQSLLVQFRVVINIRPFNDLEGWKPIIESLFLPVSIGTHF